MRTSIFALLVLVGGCAPVGSETPVPAEADSGLIDSPDSGSVADGGAAFDPRAVPPTGTTPDAGSPGSDGSIDPPVETDPDAPPFDRYPPKREVTASGSPTLDDLIGHLTGEPEPVTEDFDILSQAYFASLVVSDEAREASGQDLAVYMLRDRVAYFRTPMIDEDVRSELVENGIDTTMGDRDMLLAYWAAYTHQSRVVTELNETGRSGDVVRQTTPIFVEMCVLAAVFYSEIENNDAEYLNPDFDAFMHYQMKLAMQALAAAARVEGTVERIEARIIEIQSRAGELSPHAADLLRDSMVLPPS